MFCTAYGTTHSHMLPRQSLPAHSPTTQYATYKSSCPHLLCELPLLNFLEIFRLTSDMGELRSQCIV